MSEFFEIPWHERATITLQETSHILGVGRNSVIELIQSGDLQSVKLAGRRLLVVESVKNLVAAKAAISYSDTKRVAPKLGAKRGRPRKYPLTEPAVA